MAIAVSKGDVVFLDITIHGDDPKDTTNEIILWRRRMLGELSYHDDPRTRKIKDRYRPCLVFSSPRVEDNEQIAYVIPMSRDRNKNGVILPLITMNGNDGYLQLQDARTMNITQRLRSSAFRLPPVQKQVVTSPERFQEITIRFGEMLRKLSV